MLSGQLADRAPLAPGPAEAFAHTFRWPALLIAAALVPASFRVGRRIAAAAEPDEPAEAG